MECCREGEHSSLLGTWFLQHRAAQWSFSSQSCVQKEAKGWFGLDVGLLYPCEDRTQGCVWSQSHGIMEGSIPPREPIPPTGSIPPTASQLSPVFWELLSLDTAQPHAGQGEQPLMHRPCCSRTCFSLSIRPLCSVPGDSRPRLFAQSQADSQSPGSSSPGAWDYFFFRRVMGQPLQGNFRQ